MKRIKTRPLALAGVRNKVVASLSSSFGGYAVDGNLAHVYKSDRTMPQDSWEKAAIKQLGLALARVGGKILSYSIHTDTRGTTRMTAVSSVQIAEVRNQDTGIALDIDSAIQGSNVVDLIETSTTFDGGIGTTTVSYRVGDEAKSSARDIINTDPAAASTAVIRVVSEALDEMDYYVMASKTLTDSPTRNTVEIRFALAGS